MLSGLRSEDELMGLISLGAVGWTLWTLRRGLGDGRLPIGRAYVRRTERPGAFGLLAVLYAAAALLLAVIAADLLFHFGIRERL